jgi:hypothetical protein
VRGNVPGFCCVAPSQEGMHVGQMGRAEQYRWFAARCLEIARTTLDPQTKAAMLQMAQVWSRLAESSFIDDEPPSGSPA